MRRPVDPSQVQFRFDKRFLDDLLGSIVRSPVIAVTEIVANAYDAGATSVRITWENIVDSICTIEDNGTGLSKDDFMERWSHFSYNRREHQPGPVKFPSTALNQSKRTPFGRNGQGRWAPFCFSESYQVRSDTENELEGFVAEVKRTQASDVPVDFQLTPAPKSMPHGMSISFKLSRPLLQISDLKKSLQNKFLSDPSFEICVNGQKLTLDGLPEEQSHTITTPLGDVRVWVLQGRAFDRTSKLRGISFIRSGRYVGEPSWSPPGSEALRDARTKDGRTMSFVIELNDTYEDCILPDWSGFVHGNTLNQCLLRIYDFVNGQIASFRLAELKERKVRALRSEAESLKALDSGSQLTVGSFLDELQSRSPSISDEVLKNVASLLIKLESTKTGFQLISRLEMLSLDDLDGWNQIVGEWSARDAQAVLSEIGSRIKLIANLRRHVDDREASELHLIHPLIARSLWIFGPEYESVEFISNRTLQKVLSEYLGDDVTILEGKNRRPDIVVRPSSTASLHARDFYEAGEPNGIGQVLVIELKKGRSTIGVNEMRQAEDYINALGESKSMAQDSRIDAVVLGWKVDRSAEERVIGKNKRVVAIEYERLLSIAGSRLFHLQEAVRDFVSDAFDPEVKAVINEQGLFDGQ